MARMAAFWALAILTVWGAKAFNVQLGVWSKAMAKGMGSDENGRGGALIPVLGISVTPAFLIAGVLGAAGLFFLYRWIEKPKNADLLIDTESEMRKVTWPTFKDVVNSSLVVIFCVLFLMAYLAGSDMLIARVTRLLWFGGA